MFAAVEMKQKIARRFDRVADRYNDVAILQQAVGEDLLRLLDIQQRQPQTILDLGAGTGYFTSALAQRYPQAHIVSMDLALKMLLRAQQQSQLPATYSVIQADFDYLPLADNSVNLIFANLALQWSLDLAQTFREIQRALTPDGWLVFATLGPQTLHELKHSWQQIDERVHVNFFVPVEQIRHFLQQTHFAVIQLATAIKTQQYIDVPELLHALKAVGANQVIGGAQSGLGNKKWLRDLAVAYENYRTPQGTLPVSYEVIYGCVRAA